MGELLFDVIDFWLVGPGCYHPCVVLDGYFPGATGTGDANGQYHDYFRSEGFTPANQYAEFETELTGATGALADIAGPVTAFGGLNGTWSANVTVDTLSYRYQWYLDGAPISGAASRSLASGPPVESGVHALMAAARMMDGIELYASKDVTVMMTADVGGPSAVSAGEQTTWTAIGNAARYPLATCEWRIDGSSAGSASCSLTATFYEPQVSHSIGVTVTDARGVAATSNDLSVYVLCGTAFICDPENR